ncbi:M4 family metallopeptidase [Catellatospora methionotrophica]|uniref:M4 family metallopeptidase n=1 Tax=Catellatospora methionotrophica TaxID=121620 RepID=UPI003401C788
MRKTLATFGVAVTALVVAAVPASGSAAPADAAAKARSVGATATDIHASVGDGYTVDRVITDADGSTHTRYHRTYRGLRVHGGDFVVAKAPGGRYKGAMSASKSPLTLSITPKVGADRAAGVARSRFSGTVTGVGAAELFVDASSGTGRLAWETVVEGWRGDGQTPSRLHVVTDAVSGAHIGAFDEIETVGGTGASLYSGTVPVQATLSAGAYYMMDPLHGNARTCDMNNGTSTCTVFADTDNVWGTGTTASRQSAAVDAQFGAAKTHDYYLNVHGRNGIMGNGVGVMSRVHYGNAYANAFWDGTQMTYGDGAGNARPLVALDVAAHEMTHGLTDQLVSGGLTYSGEPGGLNEATSDILGTAVEFYAGVASDPGDYQIGEKINRNGNGTPTRYMYNPSLDGASASCWSTSTKSLDVHYSSGVANHFFFNLAEGTGATAYGTSTPCGAAPAVVGIGRAKAEKIWYRALDVSFLSNTSYVNTVSPANTARAHTLTAAAYLHGSCSAEYKAVQAAWTSVNVAGNDAVCPAVNDFALTATPAAGAVLTGGSLSTTVAAALVNGSAQTVALTASGLPSGATATFSPAAITSAAGRSTLTVTTTAATPVGTYQVTVTGKGTGATRTATYPLTVQTAGCFGTNGTDVAIPDNTTVTSKITLTACARKASAAAAVSVAIYHPYRSDLVVDLVAPDGTVYNLANRTGGNTANIIQTFPVNLSAENSNGAWSLRVRDVATGDAGRIDTWSLNL